MTLTLTQNTDPDLGDKWFGKWFCSLQSDGRPTRFLTKAGWVMKEPQVFNSYPELIATLAATPLPAELVN